MSRIDWLVVVLGICGEVTGTAIMAVGSIRAIRLNGWGNTGLFRRPAYPWTAWGLAVIFFSLLVVGLWALWPRETVGLFVP